MKKFIALMLLATPFLYYNHKVHCSNLKQSLYTARADRLSKELLDCNVSHPNFGCVFHVVNLQRQLIEADETVLKVEGCL